MPQDDPKYGYWLNPVEHRVDGKAIEYNKRWEKFWEKKHTKKQVLDEARKLMKEIYGKDVSF